MNEPASPLTPSEKYDDEDLKERGAILEDLCSAKISLQAAAEMLASRSLKTHDHEKGILCTWYCILWAAQESDQCHRILAELVVTLGRLPPAKNDGGEQLVVYKLRVWDDLPRYAWELHDAWQQVGTLPYEEEPERSKTIAAFVNINKFMAQQMRTNLPMFDDLDRIALHVMRDALESPDLTHKHSDIEAMLPAAVAWFSVLGSEMFSWEKEFPYGGKLGDPGRGGPLWNGKHGFCRERWNFWKERFLELSSSSELSEELRALCGEGAAQMTKSETHEA